MHLTYLYDPLCGWCYGAAPALDKMAKLDNLTVELAPTGLFAGEGARPLDERFAAYAWHNDQRINRLTGQVFSQLYRDQVLAGADGMFDSAPATLGIIAVGLRQLDSEREALKALQIARYIDGRNTSEIAGVADVLDQAGFFRCRRSCPGSGRGSARYLSQQDREVPPTHGCIPDGWCPRAIGQRRR